MTLTQETFAKGMAILTTRWPREMAPELSAVYAEALSVLTAEEFIVGIKRAVAELEFFPSAKQIREFARPELPAAVEAGAVLTEILGDEEVSYWDPRTGRMWNLLKIGERYGLAAQMALVAIGGVRRLRQVREDESVFPFVLREFRDAYSGYAAELRARGEVARLTAGAAATLEGPTSRRFPEHLPDQRRIGAPVRVGDVVGEIPLSGRDRAAGDR